MRCIGQVIAVDIDRAVAIEQYIRAERQLANLRFIGKARIAEKCVGKPPWFYRRRRELSKTAFLSAKYRPGVAGRDSERRAGNQEGLLSAGRAVIERPAAVR